MSKEHPLRMIRRAGVPLVGFETADPASTIKACLAALNDEDRDTSPIIEWDYCRDWRALKDNSATTQLLDGFDPGSMVFPETLEWFRQKKDKELKNTLAFVHNAHQHFSKDGVTQAIWNLRDRFKSCGATLVMLGPSIQLPSELSQDVVVITEPLPGPDEVEKIVDKLVKQAKARRAAIPDDYSKTRVIDTLIGMSAFAVEQTLAMSVSKDGIDMDELWERKRRQVEQTPGLTVWKGTETLDDLGGLRNIKTFLNKVLKSGKTPVRVIGFIDEIEKGFAGAGGDLSGVSADQLQVFLKEMQDSNIPGIILVGPPGTGKSAIAKGAGAVANSEVIAVDTGAMTGSLVGESQKKIRMAMSVLKAISQGKALFIATCNRITVLPPELRRRFTLGTFYVDLPSAEEREIIWKLWIKKFVIKDTVLPKADGWTGAEIKACCDVAFRTDATLEEASQFIVPVCKSAADKIAELRKMAENKFISASEPGPYKYRPIDMEESQERELKL